MLHITYSFLKIYIYNNKLNNYKKIVINNKNYVENIWFLMY